MAPRPARFSPPALMVLLAVPVGLVVSIAPADDAFAQTRRPPASFGRPPASFGRPPIGGEARKITTLLSLKVLSPPGVSRVVDSRWAKLFADLGEGVRITKGRPDDEPAAEEQTVGGIRRVSLVGVLDKKGVLRLPGGKRFAAADKLALRDHLRTIREFGVRGTPDGQPMWGLSAAEFDVVFRTLAEEVTEPTDGRPLAEAIAAVETKALPIHIPAAIEKQIAAEKRPVDEDFRKVAKGAAAAMLLRRFGLGLAPQRLPSGDVRLRLRSLEETDEVWPVGWEPPMRPPEAAPKLFEMQKVDFKNMKIVDVAFAIEQTVEVPIRFDRYRIAERETDLANMKCSYGPRRTSWSRVLSAIAIPNFLDREIRIDERARPFVWIKPLRDKTPPRKTPAGPPAGTAARKFPRPSR